MKVVFKTLEFIFFRITLMILVNTFKLLNFIVFTALDLIYKILFKLDYIISSICFRIYFQYVYRFLQYLWSLSKCFIPFLKKKCESYLFTPILIVKILFSSSKIDNKQNILKSSVLSATNKNITNHYKSSLFCCIVKRVC